VQGGATGGQVFITAQGSDSNIGLGFTAKLFANTNFFAAGGFQQFQIGATASSVNYLQATGAASGASPVISAQGTGTNIDVTLTPKGTGNVRFGTYTGTILTPTGYVEIKDSGGTVRRLLVG
jgi:hypothetical protein